MGPARGFLRPGRRLGGALGAAALAAGLGSCARTATQLIVVVDSDYPAGALAQVHAVTTDEGDAALNDRTFDLGAGGGAATYALPLSFGVTPRGGDASRIARITVEGLGPGGVRVQRFALASFVAGEAHVLTMFLGRGCDGGTWCGDTATCAPPGASCTVAQATVAGGSLPSVAPGQELDAATRPDGVVGLDAHDSGGGDAGLDAQDGVAAGPDAPSVDDVADTGAMDVVERTDVPTHADAADVPIDAGPSNIRPIAPLSTSRVTRNTPTLRWQLPAGASGASVTLCRNRALSTGCTLTATAASGSSFTVAPALSPGVYFWRVQGMAGSSAVGAAGPTWQFVVGARSTAVDSSGGTTLDLNGDGLADLVVAAPEAMAETGRVAVYYGRPTGLGSSPDVMLAGSDGTSSGFGGALASPGDVNGDGVADLAVGEAGYMSATGRLFIYAGGPAGVGTTPIATLDAPDGASSLFGVSVSSAGDVDGDGYGDLVVGAWRVMSGRGRAYLFMGRPSGVASSPRATAIASTMINFGKSVAGVGDINGDGHGDFVVGSATGGTVQVFLGGAGAGALAPAFSFVDPNGGTNEFGLSVAGAGDVDADGYADVIVGAPTTTTAAGLTTAGQAYIYRGQSTFPGSPTAWATLPGPVMNGELGMAVAGAGDVNGDGFADVVVGAPVTGMSGSGAVGAVYVYAGTSAGVSTSSTSLVGPTAAFSRFGDSVSGLGDVNGDGLADVAGGADGVSGDEGSAYVWLSQASHPLQMMLTFPGSASGEMFGRWIASGWRPDRRERGVADASGRASSGRWLALAAVQPSAGPWFAAP